MIRIPTLAALEAERSGLNVEEGTPNRMAGWIRELYIKMLAQAGFAPDDGSISEDMATQGVRRI